MKFGVKNIAAFSLVLLVLIKMMGMPIAWLSYAVNKDFIASELCVNKFKPALHCNGQCILMKKLAKANESNESKETKADSKSPGIDFIEHIRSYSFEVNTNIVVTYNLFKSNEYAFAFQSSIFHPPGIIA